MNSFDAASDNQAPNGHFPPQTILLVLLLAVLLGGMMGSGAAFGLGQLWGVNPQQALGSLTTDSPVSLRNYVRVANLFNHLLTFTIPAIAVAWFFFRQQSLRRLRLDKRPDRINLIAGIFFIVMAFPVAQLLYWVNRQLPLPDWVWDFENATESMIMGLLVMESPWELALNLLVVAVLPAVGEELVFRGILQQQLERLWRGAAPAIWMSAIIFSAIHLQFAGFLPRLLLGAVLGYLFYWTRNLWAPIAGHFVTNGMQVAAQYVAGDELSQINLENTEQVNWLTGLLGLALLLGAGFFIQNRNQNK